MTPAGLRWVYANAFAHVLADSDADDAANGAPPLTARHGLPEFRTVCGLPIPATVAVYRVPPSLDVCPVCVPLPGDVGPSPPGPVDAPPPQFPTTPQVF